MKICIIGSGKIGGTLAKRFAGIGHTIFLGVRNPENEKVLALLSENKNISALSINEASEKAELIIIAAVPAAVKEICSNLGNIEGKVIIDTMNSVNSKPDPYSHTADALKVWTGSNKIIKCFNSTGFENLANPIYNGKGIDMFVAGDDSEGKVIAQRLSRELGFNECYDFGGFEKIPLLEQLAIAWINLAIFQKQGRNIAFKVVKR